MPDRKSRPQIADLFNRLFPMVAAYASIIGLFLAVAPNASYWQGWNSLFTFVAACFIGWHFYSEIRHHAARSLFLSSDRAGIERYMHNWIANAGRVAIWTRDMTWANTEESSKVLTEKARDSELIIYVPKSTPLTDELRSAGAEVYERGDLCNEPKSRFTIANYGRAGARVAVGHREDDLHVIDEFSEGHHPAYWLAVD